MYLCHIRHVVRDVSRIRADFGTMYRHVFDEAISLTEFRIRSERNLGPRVGGFGVETGKVGKVNRGAIVDGLQGTASVEMSDWF